MDLIDGYMTPSLEDCVTQEPAFKNDINPYLKGEQLGKTEFSPHLRSQLAAEQRLLGRPGRRHHHASDHHSCNYLNRSSESPFFLDIITTGSSGWQLTSS